MLIIFAALLFARQSVSGVEIAVVGKGLPSISKFAVVGSRAAAKNQPKIQTGGDWVRGFGDQQLPSAVRLQSEMPKLASRALKVFLNPELVRRKSWDRARLFGPYLNSAQPADVLSALDDRTVEPEELVAAFWSLTAAGDRNAVSEVADAYRRFRSGMFQRRDSGSPDEVPALLAAAQGDISNVRQHVPAMIRWNRTAYQARSQQLVALAYLIKGEPALARVAAAKTGAMENRMIPWIEAFILRRDRMSIEDQRRWIIQLTTDLNSTRFTDLAFCDDPRFGSLPIPEWIGLECARLGLAKRSKIAGEKLAQMVQSGIAHHEMFMGTPQVAQMFSNVQKNAELLKSAAISGSSTDWESAQTAWTSALDAYEAWVSSGNKRIWAADEKCFLAGYWSSVYAYRRGDQAAFQDGLRFACRRPYLDGADGKMLAKACVLAEAGGDFRALEVLVRKYRSALGWYAQIPGPGEDPADGMRELRYWGEQLPAAEDWQTEPDLRSKPVAVNPLNLVPGTTGQFKTSTNRRYAAYLGRWSKQPNEGVLYIPAGGSGSPQFKTESDRNGWLSVALVSTVYDHAALTEHALEVIANVESRLKRKLRWRLIGFSAGGFSAGMVAKQLDKQCVGLITLGSYFETEVPHPFPIVMLLGQQDGNLSGAIRFKEYAAKDNWPVELITVPGGHTAGSLADRSKALAMLLDLRSRK